MILAIHDPERTWSWRNKGYYLKTFDLMAQRFEDQSDHRMRYALYVWKNPKYFRWLWKLLDRS